MLSHLEARTAKAAAPMATKQAPRGSQVAQDAEEAASAAKRPLLPNLGHECDEEERRKEMMKGMM